MQKNQTNHTIPRDRAYFICALAYGSRSTVNHLFEQCASVASLLIVSLKMSIIREHDKRESHMPELASGKEFP